MSKKTKNMRRPPAVAFSVSPAMAGVDGFEPSMADPKSAALPLGYTPRATDIIAVIVPKMQALF